MDKARTHIHSMAEQKSKCYAIIPAAGRSLRMGTSKLLLPWPSSKRENGTVIEQVIDAWIKSKVTKTMIVVRADDDSRLLEICKQYPVEVVLANNPLDMKASIQAGLQFLIDTESPTLNGRFFISPADLPTLSSRIINQMLNRTKATSKIVVPKYIDKAGHPVLFPWNLVQQIFDLPHDKGINQIVESSDVEEVIFPKEERPRDIDSPPDYEKELRVWTAKVNQARMKGNQYME